MPGTSTCFGEAEAPSLVWLGGTRMSWKQQLWQETNTFFLPLSPLAIPGLSGSALGLPPMSGTQESQTQGQSPAR